VSVPRQTCLGTNHVVVFASERLWRLAGHSRNDQFSDHENDAADYDDQQDDIAPVDAAGRIGPVDVDRRVYIVSSVVRHIVVPRRMRRQVGETVIEEAAAAIDAIGLVVVHMRGGRNAMVRRRRALRRWDRPVAAR